MLLFSLLVVLVTEALSLFKGITFIALLLIWSIICIGCISYIYNKKENLKLFILTLRDRIPLRLKNLNLFEKIVLSAIAVLLILVFAQGIIYPPNNRDSLTYHMARIPVWISQHSVEHFPTHIVRQLYQPPFAEYMIMHLNILNHSDYFSASVQFFFLLWALVAITLIIKALGLGRRYQIIGFILAGTIPEVLLQASSTQNDIVVAAFVLTAFYFFLRSVKQPGQKNYFYFGLAVGLSLFSKGTAYMYLAPILLIFGIDVLVKVFKTRKFSYLYTGLITVALIPLFINSGHYYRNYSFSKNILGVDKEESRIYKNEAMSVKYFAGNAVKNADLHMGILGIPQITLIANMAVRKFYGVFHIYLNDPAVTIPGTSGIPGDMLWASLYGGMLATHDDYGPNFFHFWLIVIAMGISVFVVIKKKASREMKLLLLAVFLQAIVFILYLKWQSLGTRLHTAIFLMSVPLVCYVGYVNNFFKKMIAILLPVIVLYGYLVVVFN
ncbi:MAG: glycosyltransferase family 39 protein, partial [Mucilaginibacter sp.]